MAKLAQPIPLAKPMDKFGKTVLEKMLQFRKNGVLTDVTFHVGEPERLIKGHRVVLSATSPYFRDIFMSEAYLRKSEVIVKEVEPEIFDTIVESCYTGIITPRPGNVHKLLVAAVTLKLEDIIRVCTDFIVGRLNTSTFMSAESFANEVKCQYLSKAITEYASRNFETLSKSPDFLKFSPETIQQIIENSELNISTEEDVFSAVVRWFRYDEVNRANCMPQLMSSLRMTELTPAFILKNVQPLPGCEQLALEALHWFHVPESRGVTSLRYTKARSTNLTMIAIQTTGNNNSIMRYNVANDEWAQCGELKMHRWFFKVLFSGFNLFFVGGVSSDQWQLSNSVINYNLDTQKWDTFLPMRTNRRGFCVALLRGNIYAIGGFISDKNSPVNYVEKFDTRLLRWVPMAKLLVARCYANAVVYGDMIYVTGGVTTGDVCINAVECYDSELNVWDCRGDMVHARSLHGTAVLNGYIYVIGGVNDDGYNGTVERFDPHLNEWRMMTPMNAARQQAYAVTYNERIYVLGGWRDHALDTVEVYNSQKDKWDDRAPLPEAAQYNAAVVPTFLIDRMEDSWRCANRCSSNFQNVE